MLGLEEIKAVSGASSPIVTCEVLRLTEKEMSEVHRIKVVGETNIDNDKHKKYVYLPDDYKSMLGGEYDARLVATDRFEIVESGLIISKRYCEFVEPKINLEELHK
jgi:hypothetical protein